MLAFDPHPHGCPLTFAVGPRGMNAVVKTVYFQLRDLLHCSVLEVGLRGGVTYPLLELRALHDDPKPRLVLFPGWEDEAGTRPLDFDRQFALLQRIHDEGVESEALEAFRGLIDPQRAVRPPVLRLGLGSDGMTALVNDLLDYLADLARVMVLRVPFDGKEVLVVRVYGVGPETVARLVLVPHWRAPGEPFSEADLEALVESMASQPEVPAEAFGL